MQPLLRFSAATRQPLGEVRGPTAAYGSQYARGAAYPASFTSSARDALERRRADEHEDHVGIGVILGLNERSEVVIEDLAEGWPAALSSMLARGDILERGDLELDTSSRRCSLIPVASVDAAFEEPAGTDSPISRAACPADLACSRWEAYGSPACSRCRKGCVRAPRGRKEDHYWQTSFWSLSRVLICACSCSLSISRALYLCFQPAS
jgi:hypothetical protein